VKNQTGGTTLMEAHELESLVAAILTAGGPGNGIQNPAIVVDHYRDVLKALRNAIDQGQLHDRE
jgi:hypothetical protein